MHQWWGLMPSACDSNGAFGCATENIPWVLGMLAVLVLLLIAARVALYLFELRGRPPGSTTTPVRPPKIVVPGSPLQPTPAEPVKPTPLQLRVIDAPHLKARDFASDQTKGDFGELVTDIVLTSDGWKKLASKTSSGVGIGGLYVREVKGGGGFEALAVDTKTNEAAYSPAAMSDAAVENALSALYAEGAFGRSINEAIAKELIRGLRNGPVAQLNLVPKIVVGENGFWFGKPSEVVTDDKTLSGAAMLMAKPKPVDTFPQASVTDVAVLQYTGGTTGLPKAAMLTHANLTSALGILRNWSEPQGMIRYGDDTSVLVLPLFHIFALMTLLAGVQYGNHTVLHPRFDPEAVVADIERYRPSGFSGVPTMWIAIANMPGIERRDLSSLNTLARVVPRVLSKSKTASCS